jgi:hypothetical protein
MPGRPQKPQSPEGKELRRQLYEQVIHIFEIEGVNPNAISHIIGASNRTVSNIKKNKDIATYNLVRILHCIGYELKITKISGSPKVKDNPELLQKISKFKQQQLDAKRKERKQPTGKYLPARVRIKKTRDNGVIEIVSRRQQEEEQRASEGNTFGDL